MPAALRLQGMTLPVPVLAAAEKFYRWVLAMKEAAEESEPGEAVLGWGREDRVRLVDPTAIPGARESISLRVEGLDPPEMASWLADRGLVPRRVEAFPEDVAELRDAWPDAEVSVDPDPADSNRYVLSLESPADVRVDLHVPIPSTAVVARGRHGPFYRRTKDWRGLENPGILGVTLGATDPAALADFLGALEIRGMADASDPDAPLLAGDHQFRIERREPAGIYGAAFVVAAARLPDLVRTLERFGVQHRLDRNHLLAVDPAGRILAVNGVRSG
ncbi:MAG TPA: VOC family protein [Gemmatimonadota bacterium]|nr:VOC family protein [Gemmatimonadota bacterium]